jgi:uncharacterized protein (DUF58 family)
MPRPTGRGIALLGLAVGTYLAGRVVGTWELYLFALAFLAVLAVSWVSVAVVGRQIRIERTLEPERPVAGDEPRYETTVSNLSLLPGPQLTLRSRLTGLCAGDLERDLHTIAPRASKVLEDRLPRVNRGVHVLPGMELVAEDPLGVVRAARRATGPLTVTVYPRLAFLRSCVLFPELGLKHDWAGRRGLPSAGASEFRAVRPHQPGEPLNRIDWKSTAKTGVLMLREMEDPAGADITILLDGSQAQLVGTAPHSNYETAVRAAGSIADFALRAGRGVTLLSHERGERRVVLTPDGSGRRALLEALASAQPTAPTPLALALPRLVARESRLPVAPSVTIISLSLDDHLVRTLMGLRDHGLRPAFVYVAGPSFAGSQGSGATRQAAHMSLAFLPAPGAPADEHWVPPQVGLSAEARALLLSLSAAGIPVLTLAQGDELAQVLAGGGRGGGGGGAGGGAPPPRPPADPSTVCCQPVLRHEPSAPEGPTPMKAWPRVLYLAVFVAAASVAALALDGAFRPSASADLLRAVLVASLCAAPGLVYRKAWPAAFLLLPLGALLVARTALLLPPDVEGFRAQLTYYWEQAGQGAELYTQRVFPMVLADAPALRLFWALVVYGVTALAALLGLGLRRPLLGLAPLLVLLGFGLTVDEAPRVLWAGVLFLVLAASFLGLSRALKRPGWQLRDVLPSLAVGAVATAVALLILGAAPSVAARPWQDWRTWDPFRSGGPIYSFNWLQNYPQLLDPANDQPVMQVHSPVPAYWRANALDAFTGYAWVATQPFLDSAERVPSENGYTYAVPAYSPTPRGEPALQSFRLRSVYTNYLFTGGDPVSLTVGQELDIHLNDMRALHVVAALGPNLDYSLTALVPTLQAADLVGLGSGYPEEVEPYRALPFPRAAELTGPDPDALWRKTISEVTVDGRQWLDLYSLNRQVVAGATDPYEITLRLERYLRRSYQYDLDPPASDYPSPYAAFLFDTRRGYCQHFAGSLALLLRFNGIPARVAVGFTPGDEDPAGTFTVTTNNAHAWVEAFFPTVGWVSFDPTPGRNLPTPGPSSSSPGFVDPFAAGSAAGGGTIPTLPSHQDFPGDTLPQGPTGQNAGSWLHRFPWLPWLLAALVGAAAWPAARILWRRRGLHHGPPLRRLEASLCLLRATLADFGIHVSRAATLEEVLAVIRAEVGLLPEPDFLSRTQAVLFGGRIARPRDVERSELFRTRIARVLRHRHGTVRVLLALYGLPLRRREAGRERTALSDSIVQPTRPDL